MTARTFAGLLGVGASLTTVALLLSDQAPGILDALFGARARSLWERIDGAERAGTLPAGSEITSTDFVAHVAIWAIVTVLIGLTMWTWRGLAMSAVGLAGASLVLELAQGRYATTRTVQLTDALANLVGVALGVAVAAACYIVWSTGAAVVRNRRPKSADLNGRRRGSLR